MKTVKNESSITLFCAREVGVKAFETLVKLGVDIDKVVTKKSKDCKKIISLAKRLNIPVLADVNLNHYSVQKTISENGPGVAISVSYPNIVPKKVLRIYKGRSFNFHPAQLPTYRGCLPTVWPILNGDKTAHYTLHIMDEEVDRGAIIDKAEVNINPSETGWSLYKKLENLIPSLIEKNISTIFKSEVNLPKQREIGKYYNKDLPNNGLINWSWSGSKIDKFVRAIYHPLLPSARAYIGGHLIEIISLSIMKNGVKHSSVGQVRFSNGNLFVSCKDCWVNINKIRFGKNTLKIKNAKSLRCVLKINAKT